MKILFNRPHLTGNELGYLEQACAAGVLCGDGPFSRRCERLLEGQTGSRRALLTPSCTAALELAALLCDLVPGDEVILPSYTFVSTANAFVLRGAVPVFVDIRPDTLNLDETLIEAALTPRTRVIAPVHYAGVGCAMDEILALARAHRLTVVEDAAQGVGARYRGRALGTLGELGALSFHETKNLQCGEGGALLVNRPELAERAEIMREKGTDRSRFFRGEVDKYSWQEVGSSFLPSDLTAAFLLAQLEREREINDRRRALWRSYHAAFAGLEAAERLRRPIVPAECEHNAHMYYLLLPDHATREALRHHLNQRGIHAIFHYVPLHSAPAGLRFGRVAGSMAVTERVSACLLRLPLWVGLPEQERIIAEVEGFFGTQD